MSLTYPAKTQSENFVKEKESNASHLMKNSVNWNTVNHDGWHLPATKDKHDWCGEWYYKGCLNVKGHAEATGDFESFRGCGFLKPFQKSCFRADCEKCYSSWNGRSSSKATRRIQVYEEQSHRKAKHIIISIPQWDYKLTKKELAKKVRIILDKVGCLGGAMVYHPFRKYKTSTLDSISSRYEWYFSPHFHVIGFGWIDQIAEMNKKFGYVVKNLGFRNSVFSTFYYQLSHAGIKQHNHSLTWFGDLSYSNLKVPDLEKELEQCPICANELKEIRLVGLFSHKPPDDIVYCSIDVKDYEYVVNEEFYQKVGIKIPYTN